MGTTRDLLTIDCRVWIRQVLEIVAIAHAFSSSKLKQTALGRSMESVTIMVVIVASVLA